MKQIDFKSWRNKGVILLIGLALLFSLAGVGLQNVSAAGTGPCDIYASGGTPCVAAHSTVRALFGAYSGRLYQVRRASNGNTTDIGTLEAGGFANAAAQDTFCSGTTCTITIIYDQSGRGNDLTVAPAGGNGSADTPSNATALPLTVGGHNVYGLFIAAGNGYRRNNTSGIPTGSASAGTYAVMSGTHTNSGCCFDYGNAETNNLDNGNGHMGAIYLGKLCWFSPCSGAGPWVMADLENGLFAGGNGSNSNNTGRSSTYVTAMVKNDSTTYAIRDGNGQSGSLKTDYNGALPSQSGYRPLKLEGAIILGIGGDNSKVAVGSFFEGAMTAGYPSDATEDSVQANIVAAGYGSAGGPTSTPTRTNTPGGPTPTPTRTPTPGGVTNLAQGKTASADSVQAANPVASGNDGSTTTRWCAANGNLNHWWKVDLGASHALTGSEVMWEFARNYKYRVEVSTDNTNWTTVVDKTGNTSTAQTQTDNFTATARYVRITVTGLQASPATWASFFEFRVFGN